MSAEAVLPPMLALAVPMRIREIQGSTWEWREEEAKRIGQRLAEEGDKLLFKSAGTAEMFNDLVTGIACAAFQPGGIKVLGMRFEARWNNVGGFVVEAG